MDAIQAMHSGNFVAYSYVLADNPNQVSQVYNAAFQQNVHYDAGKWHEAKIKNPDSQLAYPMPIFGFSSLSERTKQQKSHLTNLVAATDLAKTQISNLKSHTERLILTEISNCERRNNQLSLQLSKLMLQVESFALQNCKASVDFNHHRDLLEKLEKIAAALLTVQKKLTILRSSSKKIEQTALPATHSAQTTSSSTPAGPQFVSLKDSVNKRFESIYSAVIDRCRSVSSTAIHERLSRKSHDYLSELKRQYIQTPCSMAPSDELPGGSPSMLKFRTMNSFEISSNRLISEGILRGEDLLLEISKQCSSPSILADYWALVGHLCACAPTPSMRNLIRSGVDFLECKFASEITSVGFQPNRELSKLVDKKQQLYSYCRQRINIRSGDSSWIWFAVYCAFRAGWSSTLSDIAIDKGSSIVGLSIVIDCLVHILDNPIKQGSVDTAKLNSVIDSAPGSTVEEELNNRYKLLLVHMCRGDYESVRLPHLVPDCTAFDWAWFSMREILAESDASRFESKLESLRAKIDKLPIDYFSSRDGPQTTQPSSLYPSLSESLFGSSTGGKKAAVSVHHGKSIEDSKALIQLGLMHLMVLNVNKAVEVALKNKDEPFDINSPYHRCLLFTMMTLDKFNVLLNKPESESPAIGVVVEAALSISDAKERELYAGGLSSDSAHRLLNLFRALDKRRTGAGGGGSVPAISHI